MSDSFSPWDDKGYERGRNEGVKGTWDGEYNIKSFVKLWLLFKVWPFVTGEVWLIYTFS